MIKFACDSIQTTSITATCYLLPDFIATVSSRFTDANIQNAHDCGPVEVSSKDAAV